MSLPVNDGTDKNARLTRNELHLPGTILPGLHFLAKLGILCVRVIAHKSSPDISKCAGRDRKLKFT